MLRSLGMHRVRLFHEGGSQRLFDGKRGGNLNTAANVHLLHTRHLHGHISDGSAQGSVDFREGWTVKNKSDGFWNSVQSNFVLMICTIYIGPSLRYKTIKRSGRSRFIHRTNTLSLRGMRKTCYLTGVLGLPRSLRGEWDFGSKVNFSFMFSSTDGATYVKP